MRIFSGYSIETGEYLIVITPLKCALNFKAIHPPVPQFAVANDLQR
jgi:hypothetical protein